MEGIDIFDMQPLVSSRKGELLACGTPAGSIPSAPIHVVLTKLSLSLPGTMDNPIMVKTAGNEQYAGCTGYPVDSHSTVWLAVREPPIFFSREVMSSS